MKIIIARIIFYGKNREKYTYFLNVAPTTNISFINDFHEWINYFLFEISLNRTTL